MSRIAVSTIRDNITNVYSSADKVGISTNNPSYTLDVNGSFSYVLPGIVFQYAGTTAPSGFLICDGTAISRSNYNELFLVIGTIYGSGDGSNTFNLPDLRSRMLIGYNTTEEPGRSIRPIGATGGAESVTLTTNEMPSHSHGGNTSSNGSHSHTGSTSTNGGHVHHWQGFWNVAGGGSQVRSREWIDSDPYDRVTDNQGNHSHSFSSNSVSSHGHTLSSNGGTDPHENMPPFIVINYIIKF